jgi:serine/threonine-protein kinase
MVVEEGPEKGRVLSLRSTKTVEIGREGNFRLEDSGLSRKHARIRFDGTSYVVEDAGSTWGTFVNGKKIDSHVLRTGDRVRVGSHTFLFTMDEEDVAVAPTASVVAALPVDDEEEDIPSAPAAPAAPPAKRREPTTAAKPEPDEEEEVDEPSVPGECFQCGKPAPETGPGAPPDALGRPPRAYCPSCIQQYPLLGRVVANHLCQRVLGAGGMGIVYRGTHVVMGRRSALKTLRMLDDADPTMVKRLLREATAGGRIRHPNIVAVHDTGEQDGVAYVVMEYVRGENLSEALRREKKFAVKRAVLMAAQVADALAAGFKLGYIHRDIKPENILLMRKDFVKVTDFGLAKNLKDGELGGLTRTGQVLGTMLYMPPEQIVSSKGSDQRADIYSLGATIFHLISGKPVFDSKSAISLLMDIRTKPAPTIGTVEPGVPPSVDRILQRCLAKKPEDRYQTPEELAADLHAAGAEL